MRVVLCGSSACHGAGSVGWTQVLGPAVLALLAGVAGASQVHGSSGDLAQRGVAEKAGRPIGLLSSTAQGLVESHPHSALISGPWSGWRVTRWVTLARLSMIDQISATFHSSSLSDLISPVPIGHQSVGVG